MGDAEDPSQRRGLLSTGSPDASAVPADEHAFVGRPHRTLLALTAPLMVSLIAEPLTGVVDTAFVARLGGAT